LIEFDMVFSVSEQTEIMTKGRPANNHLPPSNLLYNLHYVKYSSTPTLLRWLQQQLSHLTP